MTIENTRHVTMYSLKKHFHTMLDCEVRLTGLRIQIIIQCMELLRQMRNSGKQPQSDRCKPKKHWKPDTDRMAEYNELLWDKEEQRRKKHPGALWGYRREGTKTK